MGSARALADCNFEHVRGVRTLNKTEKQSMRDILAKHNASTVRTGFAALTPDPSIVGV